MNVALRNCASVVIRPSVMAEVCGPLMHGMPVGPRPPTLGRGYEGITLWLPRLTMRQLWRFSLIREYWSPRNTWFLDELLPEKSLGGRWAHVVPRFPPALAMDAHLQRDVMRHEGYTPCPAAALCLAFALYRYTKGCFPVQGWFRCEEQTSDTHAIELLVDESMLIDEGLIADAHLFLSPAAIRMQS